MNFCKEHHPDFRCFSRFKPVESVAYSYRVYHLTLEDANRVRRELGLRELPRDGMIAAADH